MKVLREVWQAQFYVLAFTDNKRKKPQIYDTFDYDYTVQWYPEAGKTTTSV